VIIFGGGSPKSMLVYGLVSIAILAFSYFVIIKPVTDSTTTAVDNASQQINQAFPSGGSNSSTGNATADDVYNACIKAINGSAAGKSGCTTAKNTFQQCASQAQAAGGLAEDSALQACQDAANQTVAALKAAG
jgi:hypothetical protein